MYIYITIVVLIIVVIAIIMITFFNDDNISDNSKVITNNIAMNYFNTDFTDNNDIS